MCVMSKVNSKFKSKWHRETVTVAETEVNVAGQQTPQTVTTEWVRGWSVKDYSSSKKKERKQADGRPDGWGSTTLGGLVLNFKDTNKIQQAEGEWRHLPLICPLCCCFHRSQILLWARWGRWSITTRKWPLALILISAGLEQISWHLSPYLSPSLKQQLPSDRANTWKNQRRHSSWMCPRSGETGLG